MSATEKTSPALIYAIGDIHGTCGLLGKAARWISEDRRARGNPDTAVVTLGDYIDRGPESAAVIERLANNPFAPARHIALKGNHEDAMLGFLDDPFAGEYWLTIGGVQTIRSYGLSICDYRGEAGLLSLARDFKAAIPPRHLGFLEGLATSWTAGDLMFVHAGIRPGVPLEQQDPNDLIWIRDEFLTFDAPLPRFVIHGHTPVGRAEVRRNRMNIDTGACFGGHLSVLAIDETNFDLVEFHHGEDEPIGHPAFPMPRSGREG
ncbi:serine/threonine protein phosphatase [Rhizobiales bacterium]|uniref:metallophosphoesterase n=1 Tax=Hongsoonwoonella zoysiae TaxID=2821844 RepID=UPI0015602B94|nr:metallophosphoesterase [Hongsoonwoonella zoysiae]NRG17951.1 serine/threonine protein phosphatase [Hongsoonwoonella zoysiae]